MLFDKVTIIGMGLIGSSLARVARQNKIAGHIVAADISEDVCERVKALGIADTVTSDMAQSVVGADLVMICIPVGSYDALGRAISPMLKPGAILSDVGSVKSAVVESLSPHIPEGVHFVPGHPIAGTEHSGPEAGFAELFKDRWSILTPPPETAIRAVEAMTAFWEACGSCIEIMDAQRHDLVLGITSHLPHLIAYTIVGTADDLEDDLEADVIKFSASGFRGFTRIAASDPVMWRDVFLYNRDAVLETLGRFTEDLTALKRAIRRGDGAYLEDVFTRTRKIRRSIIEEGPAARPMGQEPSRDE